MAARDGSQIDTNSTGIHPDLKKAKACGLGLGIDVTDHKPWKLKYFDVRRNTAPDDILELQEPGKVEHYERSVQNRNDLILKAGANAGALYEAVNVSMDVGFSRKHSHLQEVRGIKVHTRTVCFKVIPGDTTETSFERELHKDINFDSIKVDDKQTLRKACEEFVRKYTITHYVTALMLGALKYQVVSSNQQTTQFSSRMTALSGEARTDGSFTSVKFSKDIVLQEIGRLADNYSVKREEVIEMKIAPIYTLVRTPMLADALKDAVAMYCNEKLPNRTFTSFACCMNIIETKILTNELGRV